MQLVAKDEVRPDIKELGQAAGMTLNEIERTVNPDGGDTTGGTPGPTAPDGGGKGGDKPATGNAKAVQKEIVNRVRPQIQNAFKDGSFAQVKPTMGFKRRLEKVLESQNRYDPIGRVTRMYDYMDTWFADMISLGTEEFGSAADFMNMFETVLDAQINELNAA